MRAATAPGARMAGARGLCVLMSRLRPSSCGVALGVRCFWFSVVCARLGVNVPHCVEPAWKGSEGPA